MRQGQASLFGGYVTSRVTPPRRFSNSLRYRSGRHDSHRQLTPPYVLEPIREVMGGIGLDPCTEPDNPTDAERFYTAADNGLLEAWCGPDWLPSVYVNPPYGRAKEPWVERCIRAGVRGQRVVLLIPSHTDTGTFQRALASATMALFVRGRVKFGVLRKNRRQEAASHPSVLIAWNVDLSPCGYLGLVVSPIMGRAVPLIGDLSPSG